jgi:hypothetical protein
MGDAINAIHVSIVWRDGSQVQTKQLATNMHHYALVCRSSMRTLVAVKIANLDMMRTLTSGFRQFQI